MENLYSDSGNLIANIQTCLPLSLCVPLSAVPEPYRKFSNNVFMRSWPLSASQFLLKTDDRVEDVLVVRAFPLEIHSTAGICSKGALLVDASTGEVRIDGSTTPCALLRIGALSDNFNLDTMGS